MAKPTMMASAMRQLLLAPGLIGALGTAAMAENTRQGADPAPVVRQDPDATVQYADENVTRWRQVAQDECLQPGEAPTSRHEEILQRYLGYLSHNGLGERALMDLKGSQFTFCTAQAGGLVPGAFTNYLPSGDAAIFALQNIATDVMPLGLHEIRHGWQDRHGLFDQLPLQGRQDRFALMLMMEADAHSFTVAAAYQLHQAGLSVPWQGLQNLEGYRQMARAFEQSLGATDTPQNLTDDQLRRGMRAAYDAWFDQTDFPARYMSNAPASWADAPMAGHPDRASLRSLSRIVGQLPGDAGRASASYIGLAELARAEAVAKGAPAARADDHPATSPPAGVVPKVAQTPDRVRQP